jgi:hypothetical protein
MPTSVMRNDVRRVLTADATRKASRRTGIRDQGAMAHLKRG